MSVNRVSQLAAAGKLTNRRSSRARSVAKKIAIPFVATLVILAFSAIPASAAVPAYFVNTASTPTNLPPGGKGRIVVEAYNLGDAPAMGNTSPIVITDKLPAGLEAKAISGKVGGFGALPCDPDLKALRCEYQGALAAYQFMQMELTVEVAEHLPVLAVNEVNVSGGGAAGVVSREQLTVSAAPTEFGVEKLKLVPTNEDGSVDTRAGSHPFQLTSRLDINNAVVQNPNYPSPEDEPLALTKDLHFNLPAGLVGGYRVVPVAVEVVAVEVDFGELGVADFYLFGVVGFVEAGVDLQAGACGGARDQVDDRGVVDQRLAAPVVADEAEQAVLDFVPLAGPAREVADHDLKPDSV